MQTANMCLIQSPPLSPSLTPHHLLRTILFLTVSRHGSGRNSPATVAPLALAGGPGALGVAKSYGEMIGLANQINDAVSSQSHPFSDAMGSGMGADGGGGESGQGSSQITAVTALQVTIEIYNLNYKHTFIYF